MINRDLYGLRLRTGVAWPGEGSSYCTFVLAISMTQQRLQRGLLQSQLQVGPTPLRLNASRCAATATTEAAVEDADATATYVSVD